MVMGSLKTAFSNSLILKMFNFVHNFIHYFHLYIIVCEQDGYNGVVDANPDLKWWFDELEATAKKLGEQGQKCKALNGIKKL